jgi:hypothetical protein
MACGQFTTKLGGRIHRRIHLSSGGTLRVREGGDDIVERDTVADDHDVNITSAFLCAGGYRTVDKRGADCAGQRLQGAPQYLGHAERLANQRPEFREYRRVLVRLKVSLVPFDGPDDNPGSSKGGEFSLHRASTLTEHTNKLTLVESPFRVAEESSKHGLTRGAEERRSNRVRRRIEGRSHSGYYRTQSEVHGQAGSGRCALQLFVPT